MDSNLWKEKRVLVTGYEGFLGSWLTKELLEYKANVVGLDILTGRKNTALTKDDSAKIKVINGSVENFQLLSEIIKDNKIQFVFHLAAESLVGFCKEDPLKAFSVNIKGTWNVLEASRDKDCMEGIIIASSDKAYGSHENLPYKENFALLGEHPYDVSKSCADLLARTYFHTYNLPVCVTRCGNIYGGGDFNFSRIIPDAIRSIVKGKTLMIRSDGSFMRDYIYIGDVVNAYFLLAQEMIKGKLFGETFNFSNQKPISVLNLVKTIYEVAGKSSNYKILNQAEFEIINQYLCADKAKSLLGLEFKHSLAEGLKKTLAWYKEFLNSTI